MLRCARSVCLLILFGFAVFGRAAPPTWPDDPVAAAAELEQQWILVNDPQRHVGIRGLFRFVLEATALDWHPERVESALLRARSMQDRNQASPTFGNFRWNSGHPGVIDLNAVEFSAQLMGFIRLQQSDRLSLRAQTQLDEMMVDAIAGLRSHVVKVEYTNIFVMKAWGLISLGEALGRKDVAEDGYQRFDEWMAYTARHGIGEYGAVVYYGIDLDSLALLAKFAGRTEARANAKRAIRYVWTDLAANWWKPGERMGGTNSRSYDYLFGHGYTEAHTWTTGWLRERPELEGAGWLSSARDHLTTFRSAVMWRPETEWTEPIRAQVPRTVVQSWGENSGQSAVNWIGRNVSLASSGASRSRDERTLVANLGDSPQVPQLTMYMEGRGDPYGRKKLVGGKSLHLTPFIANVQSRSQVLQVLSDEPVRPDSRNRPGELSYFATHFTLPAAAEVWLGENRAEPGTPSTPTVVPAGTAIVVRLGDAAIGLRLLLANTTDGGTAPVHFIADTPDDIVRRITILHASDDPRGRATLVAFLSAKDDLTTAAFAGWRKKFAATRASVTLTGNLISAQVAGETGNLRIEADIVQGERRQLQGGEPPALLSVNGRDVGRSVLAAPDLRR